MDLVEDIRKQLAQGADDAAPLYQRLAEAIRTSLAAGAEAPGVTLPGERRLAEALDVSRVTVRKAIDCLVAERSLVRRHGARTVAAARVEKSLSRLTSFSEDIRARGYAPGAVWIARSVGPATPAEVMALGLGVDQEVCRMVRLRTADGEPVAIERSTVPRALLDSPHRVKTSLYAVLYADGVAPVRAVQRLYADVMSAEDARHLGCTPGEALLVIERRCFLGDGRVVEYCQTRYRGDAYDFAVELTREADEPFAV
ncbi:MAG: GntR family transcriptional regulator [Alphaproteobacteria bacterium]